MILDRSRSDPNDHWLITHTLSENIQTLVPDRSVFTQQWTSSHALQYISPGAVQLAIKQNHQSHSQPAHFYQYHRQNLNQHTTWPITMPPPPRNQSTLGPWRKPVRKTQNPPNRLQLLTSNCQAKSIGSTRGDRNADRSSWRSSEEGGRSRRFRQRFRHTNFRAAPQFCHRKCRPKTTNHPTRRTCA